MNRKRMGKGYKIEWRPQRKSPWIPLEVAIQFLTIIKRIRLVTINKIKITKCLKTKKNGGSYFTFVCFSCLWVLFFHYFSVIHVINNVSEPPASPLGLAPRSDASVSELIYIFRWIFIETSPCVILTCNLHGIHGTQADVPTK